MGSETMNCQLKSSEQRAGYNLREVYLKRFVENKDGRLIAVFVII